MRFFWPMRDRSWSSDSEASTASQSSVASDASFYSASSGQSERGAALGYTSPDDDSSHGYPRSDSESGLGVHTFAPVLGWPEPETGLLEPPRVPLLFSTDAISGAATSGRGLQPPSPFASQLPSQTGSPVAQTGTRSAAAAHGLLGPGPAPSGPPTATPRTSASSPGAAGSGSAYEPPPDPQARRLAAQDPPLGPPLRAAAPSAPCDVFRPGRAGGTLPDWAASSAGLTSASTPPTAAQARRSAAQVTWPASPPLAAAHSPQDDERRPGRAAARLPVRSARGSTLAAATARALAVCHEPNDDLDDDSSDDDGQDRDAAAPAPRQDSASVLPRPGRAGGTLVDGGMPGVATTGPVPSPAAVATAPGVEAAAAAYADAAADRAAVEHHVRAALTQDQDYQASARVEPILGDALSSSRCISKTWSRDDDADTRCNSAVVSAPMDMAQGPAWPTVRLRPLSPPLELRVGGKRRRLNGEDEDDRKLAELLLVEEEASTHHQAPRLPATSARPASVLAVYAHNAQRFTCTLCVYSAASFAALTRHRDSRHRRVSFTDRFSAGCACGTPFASRLAAATHAQACASLSANSATDSTTAGAPSPTAAGPTATVTAAVTAAPDLPPQVASELTASPPLVSSTNVDVQEHRMTVQDELLLQQQQPQQPREKDAQWHQHQQHDVKQQQDESSRWGPPLPPTTIASRIADRLSELPAPRWGPLLPRDTVVSRIVERLEDVPAPRWGPPLPRRIVASRIAERLAPVTSPANSEVTAAEEDKVATPADVTLAYEDEESKECEPPSMVNEETKDSEEPAATAGEWLLKFDGGCRGAPGPGGAGAVLFNPSGAAAWSCSCYMPGNTETNNTAEYTALLLGARAAADHGATRLRVQGDSQLVIRQVKGIYGTKSTRLRNLRNATRAELTRVGQFTLHHIDRQDNAHADRLANRALDMKSTLVECADHPGRNACTTTLATAAEAAPPPTPPPVGAADVPMEDGADEERQADIDDGEVYAPMHFGPDEVPARRPRLRLRQLTEDELDSAGEVVERLSAMLSAKITDADDWETAEGYITALPYLLYDKLQPYCQKRPGRPQPNQHQRQSSQQQHQQGRRQQQHATATDRDVQGTGDATGQQRRRRRRGRRRGRRSRRHQRQTGDGGGGTRQKQSRQPRPPRVTRHHREHRIDEAIDELHALERARPQDRPAIAKARRRVGRIRSAINQHLLRHQFDTDEKTCVDTILEKARTARATRAAPSEGRAAAAGGGAAAADATEPVDDGVCPISSDELWRHFTSVNTPAKDFDADDSTGAVFRAAMARLPAATRLGELLTEAPTADDIEDQLQRVRGASSPGLDGVGYDVYKRFATQLLPVLTAAFKRCWTDKRVPQSWKLGVVRLLHKKGDREDPTNWRPICLQQSIYKLYTGVLARRLARWMDVNERHGPGQKGFRAVNGCGEHNFLAATLIDQARRKHRPLYEVWYDLKNAFGSVPFALLWDALRRLGVPAEYVDMCKGLYDNAAFVVGNAVDGSTAPVQQRVGVFQGCPLSPQLFNAAISPLLFALRRLPAAGVQLSGDDRLGVSAYADDLKIFSGTKAAIAEQHELVAEFLNWSGMEANPAKCKSMGVRRNGNGAIEADNLELALDGSPIPTMTHLQSYTYLGIGDGFDHVRRRIELAPKLKSLKQDATALMEAGLAPWQVVKAVKVYLYPRVEYALRHLRPEDQHLESFDLHLRRGLRHLLRLPKTATNEFFYAPVSRGGLGLLPLVELHAALQIAHGWQMLHSPDRAIRRVAREQLHQIADARHRLDKEHWKQRPEELCELLLNGELGTSAHAPPKRRNGDIGSMWVDVRKNLKAFGLKLATAPANSETGIPAQPLQLRVPHHAEWLDHSNVLRYVKQHMKNTHWRAWCTFEDQGRTARAHGGVGSGFITRPRGMWESDYRFAVAARLNAVDTANTLSRRRLRAHDRCRHPGCRWKETLAHVLNHCPGTMDAVRGRHDDALKEIEHTLRASSGDRRELRVNQTVPGLPGPALRPDIQVYNHDLRTVAVVDLAVAFDEQASDDPESSGLAKAIQTKKAKYAGIKRHLERQGWKVHLSALVYGSLGSVAPSNHKVYTEHLGVLKRDAKRLDRQLSVACITSSRRIWNLHCAKHRARQHQDQDPSRQASRGRRVTETGGTPSRTDRR